MNQNQTFTYNSFGGSYNLTYALSTPEHRVRNFTATEVAERLRISVQQVNRLARQGKLRPLPETGGRGREYVFHELEISRFENLKKPLHI
jgi:hypothetical protein